jgi:hypothetical protein
VDDQAERYQATMGFFYKAIDDQRRTDIIRNYNATHILVSEADKGFTSSLYNWLDGHAMPVSTLHGYRLFAVVENSLGPASPPAAEVLAGNPQQPVALPRDPASERPPRPAPAPEHDPVHRKEQAGGQAFGVPIAAPQTQSYGAPIPEPILDPEMNGG